MADGETATTLTVVDPIYSALDRAADDPAPLV